MPRRHGSHAWLTLLPSAERPFVQNRDTPCSRNSHRQERPRVPAATPQGESPRARRRRCRPWSSWQNSRPTLQQSRQPVRSFGKKRIPGGCCDAARRRAHREEPRQRRRGQVQEHISDKRDRSTDRITVTDRCCGMILPLGFSESYPVRAHALTHDCHGAGATESGSIERCSFVNVIPSFGRCCRVATRFPLTGISRLLTVSSFNFAFIEVSRCPHRVRAFTARLCHRVLVKHF
jgi:hypothetical protein